MTDVLVGIVTAYFKARGPMDTDAPAFPRRQGSAAQQEPGQPAGDRSGPPASQRPAGRARRAPTAGSDASRAASHLHHSRAGGRVLGPVRDAAGGPSRSANDDANLREGVGTAGSGSAERGVRPATRRRPRRPGGIRRVGRARDTPTRPGRLTDQYVWRIIRQTSGPGGMRCGLGRDPTRASDLSTFRTDQDAC